MYRLKTLSERKVKITEARNYFLKVFTDDSGTGVGKTNERSMAKALGLYEGEGMSAITIQKQRPALRLVSTKGPSRNEWLKLRKQGIGRRVHAAVWSEQSGPIGESGKFAELLELGGLDLLSVRRFMGLDIRG